MYEQEETALYLRRWLEDKGGGVEIEQLSEFYARFPLHAQYVRGNLTPFLASYSHMFTSTKDAISLSQDVSPDMEALNNTIQREDVATKLERFVLARGGAILISHDLHIFYNENPGVRFPKSFKEFVMEFSGRFSLSTDCAQLTSRTVLGQNSATQDLADALEAFILEQPHLTLNAGSIGLFYQRHPGLIFPGGVKSWIEKSNGRFRFESNIITLGGVRQPPTGRPGRISSPSFRPKTSSQPSITSQNRNSTNVRIPQPSLGRATTQSKRNLPVLQYRPFYERNQGGVDILPDPKLVSSSGFIPHVPVEFQIHNRSDGVHSVVKINITNARNNSNTGRVEIVNAVDLINSPIGPSAVRSIELRWNLHALMPRRVRIFVIRVEFIFQAGFSISRFIAVNAGGTGSSARALKMARASSEYFRPTPVHPNVHFHVDPNAYGPRPKGVAQQLRANLPNVKLIRNTETSVLYIPYLRWENYTSHFMTLLHLNFEFECKELELSDLVNEHPSDRRTGPRGELLVMFKCKALGEKRPSVLEGDRVWCQISGTKVGGKRGVVRLVTAEEVGIEFAQPKDIHTNQRYDVRFEPNDFNFKMQHEALLKSVNSREGLNRLFAPSPADESTLYRCTCAPCFLPPCPCFLPPCVSYVPRWESHDLQTLTIFRKLNAEQRSAVRTIVNGMPMTRISPFLLFGPPGTGKTTTLVAAVVCLLFFKPQSKILVSASSNSACDVFYDKLRKVSSLKVIVTRLLASSRVHAPQPIDDLVKAQVIVATCMTSGNLSALPRLGFTHVFLEEAGQSTEIESLIPLFMACDKPAQLILGGDHKQLGPVVRDNFLVTVGRMDISLFERLMRRPGYVTFDPLYAVMLSRNYRAHHDLLRVPSRLFYNGYLVANNPAQRTSLTEWCWSFTGGVHYPLIVHHVDSKEDRELTCPSWFNLAECGRVMDCIRALRQENPDAHLDIERDVVIIAPYAAQVRKIKIFLQEEGLHGLKVGSVESFQGSEARIVIVSTCRSSSMNGDYDAVHHVGFLKNEKRFNVAITRAMEMLIVVGNIHVLKTDYHWKELVGQAEEAGSLVFDDTDGEGE